MPLPDWLDPGAYTPRSHCGPWPDWLVWESIAANGLTALAYWSIPATIAWLWLRARDRLPSPWMAWLFVAFIGLCGTRHALDVAAFWWPFYPAFTQVEALMAVASVATAITLPAVARRIAEMPTADQYRDLWLEAQAQREEAQAQRDIKHAMLDRANARVLELERRSRVLGHTTSPIGEEIAELRRTFRESTS